MKKLIMKMILVSTLLIPELSFGQQAYKLLTNQDGINFYYNDQLPAKGEAQFVAVKIENPTNFEIEVEWVYHVWYNGQCRSCIVKEPDNFYYKKIKIAPGAKYEHDYSMPDKDGLQIYKKFNKSQLSKLEFSGIKIKKIEPKITKAK